MHGARLSAHLFLSMLELLHHKCEASPPDHITIPHILPLREVREEAEAKRSEVRDKREAARDQRELGRYEAGCTLVCPYAPKCPIAKWVASTAATLLTSPTFSLHKNAWGEASKEGMGVVMSKGNE